MIRFDRLAFLALLAAGLAAPAICATAPAALQISNETAPAGGWAQIKIYAVKPAAIAAGHLVLSLDSTVFGPGAAVGLFGANGDAQGLATLTGSQMDVHFSSATGGIGQLAGLPVMVVSVPVLATAVGRTVAVTATSPDSSLTVAAGSVAVKGTLSVSKIPAGMGVVAAGTVVPVTGTGFTTATTVTIDGVAIASTQFVSAQEVDVTLGGAAELVGKRARVQDSGAEFDYFCFQPGDPVNVAGGIVFGIPAANIQPLFPLFASTGLRGSTSEIGGVIEVQNPNDALATVTVTNNPNCCGPPQAGTPNSLAIPAGSWAQYDGGADTTFIVSATLPVRVLPLEFCGRPLCLGTEAPYDANALGPTAPLIVPAALAFAWQKGSPAPAARSFLAGFTNFGFVTITAAVASSGSWLSVSTGTASSAGYTFSASVNPSQLAAGTYQGSILVTPSYGPPATLPVTLTVTASAVPMISANPASLTFNATTFTATPSSQTIALTSDSGPAAFSVTLLPGTWLKVSPMSGMTPATLTVTWDPAVTSQIYYQQRSTPDSFLISGPGNALTIPATFNVTGVQTFQTYLGASGGGPNGLVFSAQAGSSPQTQSINVDPAGTITATVDQPWMTPGAANTATVAVTVNPSGLVQGNYSGTVTIGEPGKASIAVPVALGVWSTAPPLTISTGNFTFVQTVGEAGPAVQTAEVDSGGIPVPLTIAVGGNWLNVDQYKAPTPARISVGVVNPPGTPGEYDGSFTITSPGGKVYAPVTLLVEPGPLAPPVISQVVNAASETAGAVSPGEIVSVRGYGVGAAAVGGVRLDPSGAVVSLINGLQVTFDSKPAPLIYTSANQTNLIVPYEVAGKTSTVMQVTYAAATGTLQSAAWVLPVAATAPGVFTLDATGTGQAALVNQDLSVNGPANPAPRGSVVSIYATGEGQTSPAGVTGSVAPSDTNTTPVLPVTVSIGGLPAAVQYAGAAPGEVSGLLQVNVVVPPGVVPGSAVPVSVTMGGVASPAGVTMAVK